MEKPKKIKTLKILFTGGGTGGHAIPIIAVARELRRIYPEGKLRFSYLGPKEDEVDRILLSQEEIRVKTITSGKIRRYSGFKPVLENIVDIIFKIPFGTFQAFLYLFFHRPHLVFSKGGYGSFSTVVAAKLLFIPVFIQESDITPGLTNKLLSKISKKVFVSFPRTEYFSYEKMILLGNPVRKEVLEGTREEAKETFNLILDRPVVLVLGGSQGAQRINDEIVESLPDFLNNFELIHQCGENNFEQVRAEAKVMMKPEQEKYYHPYPYLKEPELRQAYAAADFIISRAGSGTIFEIAAMNKPAILVPLTESAQDHQLKNAYAYAEKGAAIVMEEDNFTPHFLIERLKYFFENRNELEKMQKAAKDFSKPLAAQQIAEYLIKYLVR